MLIKLTAAAALLLVSQAGAAHDLVGHWKPYSRTAMAITGAVSFEKGVMSLQGKPMFRYEAQGPDYYRLEPLQDTNPTLLNGNRLCGEDSSPAWMRISQERDGILSVTILDQTALGPGDESQSSGVCGVYNFTQ